MPHVYEQSEAQFQATVIDLARRDGWRVAHFHDSRRMAGGRLIGDKDAAGFPDLVLARAGAVVFAELKSERGRVAAAQLEWIDELHDGHSDAHLWRPSDWPEIEQLLARNRRCPG